MQEFELISKYFANQELHRPDVLLGIGDDAALVQVPSDQALVITTDSLVSGIHFPENTLPFDIGYKSLAVNLSDLAAMGASPAWLTLCLTMPDVNPTWLQAFSAGFFALANLYKVQLIGGDLTRGPLSITVQAQGLVKKNQALLRSNAKVGDLIYVSGTLGDAGLALLSLKHQAQLSATATEAVYAKLNRPEPRLALGQDLAGLAHAAIDISDGLSADLGHILEASKLGADIALDLLPLSRHLKTSLNPEKAIALALNAGDDYELCFTLPEKNKMAFEKISAALPHPCTYIGKISASPGLRLFDSQGNLYKGPLDGYQHF
jgi:thiamine-monophosphate kinase